MGGISIYICLFFSNKLKLIQHTQTQTMQLSYHFPGISFFSRRSNQKWNVCGVRLNALEIVESRESHRLDGESWSAWCDRCFRLVKNDFGGFQSFCRFVWSGGCERSRFGCWKDFLEFRFRGSGGFWGWECCLGWALGAGFGLEWLFVDCRGSFGGGRFWVG